MRMTHIGSVYLPQTQNLHQRFSAGIDFLSHSRDFWKCLEPFLIVETGRVLLAKSGSRPKVLLNIQQRIIWPKVFIVPKLRNPDLNLIVRKHLIKRTVYKITAQYFLKIWEMRKTRETVQGFRRLKWQTSKCNVRCRTEFWMKKRD